MRTIPFQARPSPATVGLAVFGAACAIVGIVRAVGRMWIGDDPYISFRYARNLVEGAGLVYNVGERVEGYSNFSWTLWAALAQWLGRDPVAWALWSGIVCYVASLLLLAANHGTLRRALGVHTITLPAAALLAAWHTEWNIWATGGLETSCFTVLGFVGFLLLVGSGSPRRLLAAGLVLGLASLTRPDGVLFAAVGGGFVVADALIGKRSALRAGSLYALGFIALWLPHLVWRLAYYGDLFPNTYYAKSAYDTWYAQGWIYLRLFYTKYWVLTLAPPAGWLAALAARRRGVPEGSLVLRQAALATAMVAVYTFWVVRIGGDFMYGRMLVPTLPMLAVLADIGLLGLTRYGAGFQPLGAALASVALLTGPSPIAGSAVVHGVTNEPAHHSAQWDEEITRASPILRRFLEGLDVTVVFTGSEARLMYEARIPRALEAETGLTDRVVARQRLDQRGRIGHEKHADLDYLLEERKAHLTFKPYGMKIIGGWDRLPKTEIFFDGVRGFVLHWDPALMAELRRRGAVFEDFPDKLDRVIPRLESLPPGEVGKLWQMSKLFYFDHVRDPRRLAAFERALGRDLANERGRD